MPKGMPCGSQRSGWTSTNLTSTWPGTSPWRWVSHVLIVHSPTVCPPSVISSCWIMLVWPSLQNHGIDYGDISQRVALRKRLQCKDFEWYLDNIYPEMRRYNSTLFYGEVSLEFRALWMHYISLRWNTGFIFFAEASSLLVFFLISEMNSFQLCSVGLISDRYATAMWQIFVWIKVKRRTTQLHCIHVMGGGLRWVS